MTKGVTDVLMGAVSDSVRDAPMRALQDYIIGLVELLPGKVALTLTLMVALSLTEGVGLLMLVPMLQLIWPAGRHGIHGSALGLRIVLLHGSPSGPHTTRHTRPLCAHYQHVRPVVPTADHNRPFPSVRLRGPTEADSCIGPLPI